MASFSQRLVTSLPWLDAPASLLKKIGEPILGQQAPRGPRDFLYGVWLGHPLHPMVVVAPLGCWLSSAGFDMLGEEAAADLSLEVGTVSALGVALTGMAQWQDAEYDAAPRRIGTLHALLNVSAVGCYTASWICRARGNRGAGMWTAWTGLGFAVAAGWLGGDLAYGLGLGVNRNAFAEPSEQWTDVAQEADLTENQPKRVNAAGIPVMLLKQDGSIHAIAATCPHLGGPLDEGTIEDETVTCPWHGSVFNVETGAVLHGPATFNTPRYDVRVQNGTVAVRPAVS